jgi:hypothetical protein
MNRILNLIYPKLLIKLAIVLKHGCWARRRVLGENIRNGFSRHHLQHIHDGEKSFGVVKYSDWGLEARKSLNIIGRISQALGENLDTVINRYPSSFVHLPQLSRNRESGQVLDNRILA